MNDETKKEFAKQQALRDRPACFGKYGTGKCATCWFHPDCKKTKAKPVIQRELSKKAEKK